MNAFSVEDTMYYYPYNPYFYSYYAPYAYAPAYYYRPFAPVVYFP